MTTAGEILVTLCRVKDDNSFQVEDTIDAIFPIGLTFKDAAEVACKAFDQPVTTEVSWYIEKDGKKVYKDDNLPLQANSTYLLVFQKQNAVNLYLAKNAQIQSVIHIEREHKVNQVLQLICKAFGRPENTIETIEVGVAGGTWVFIHPQSTDLSCIDEVINESSQTSGIKSTDQTKYRLRVSFNERDTTVTIRDFLATYYISQRLADDQTQFVPFQFVPAGKFDTLKSTSTKSCCDNKERVRLGRWTNIRNEFANLYQANTVKLDQKVPIPSQPETYKLVNVAQMDRFCDQVFDRSIVNFFPDVKINQLDIAPGGGEPGLVFTRYSLPDSPLIIMENTGFECLNYHSNDPLEIFTKQEPSNMAQPLNQIIAYLLISGCKYGILSDLRYIYAFRFTGRDHNGIDYFEISEPFLERELIYLVFCLTITATEDHRPVPRKRFPPKVDALGNQSIDQSPSTSRARSRPTRGSKYRKKKAIKGHYDAEADIFKNLDDFEQIMTKHFEQWSFDVSNLTRITLGTGRCGRTSLGYVVNKQDGCEVECAIKVADISKRPYLQDEMKDEIRTLVYLNNIGVKCVPTICWAGSMMGVLYMIATEYIDGYSPECLDELNENEKEMFDQSLVELRKANVIHGDLRESNVIFTDERCYIIDFGMSQIITEDTCWKSLEDQES